MRYRGSIRAELYRALAALKALQAEAAAAGSGLTVLPPVDFAKRTRDGL